MAEERQPNRKLMPRVHVLSFGGQSKQVADAQAAEDDPFAAAGLYQTGGKIGRKIVIPPLGEGSLRALVEFVDSSNVLPQAIAAFQTNIDGFGHRWDFAVKEEEFPQGQLDAAKTEKDRLEEFFTYCHADGSFVDLRKRTRYDVEATGQGYWEVIRDQKGEITRLSPIPSYTMRVSVLDSEAVTIDEIRRVGLTMKKVKLAKRFRVFVQITYAVGRREIRWFKEYGDPRILNTRTGQWNTKGDKTNAANEVICFRAGYRPTTPYSLPRWIGNLPSVLGSRAAEEINLLYFDNKTIPPLVIAVSGGMLTKGTIQRIQNVLDHEIRGRENFHKALVIEAAPADETMGPQRAAPPRIEIKPLTDRMATDAMFMGYDDANRAKIRSSFRLPPIFVGETAEYSRATAETSLHMAEEQVFRPERVEFDFFMNRWLIVDLGGQFLKLVSLGPNITLNEDLVTLLSAAETAGAMTPNLGRQIMSDVLERDVPMIEEEWGDVPFSLSLTNAQTMLALGLGAGLDDDEPEDGQPQEPDAAKRARRAAAALLARRLPPAVKRAVVGEIVAQARAELQRRRRNTG